MRRPVDFDDQLRRVTKKVDDKFSDRRLPSKAPAIELIAAQPFPQKPFSDALGLS